MTRSLIALVCSVLLGTQAVTRAQDAPAVSPVRLEELLSELGRRHGIVITSEAPLNELVFVADTGTEVQTTIERVLSRHSYVFIYGGAWSDPLVRPPDVLRIFSRNSGGIARVINGNQKRESETELRYAEVDEIAYVQSIIDSAGDSTAEHVAALALELTRSENELVREEVLYALAEAGSDMSVTAIAQALGDESVRVRQAAVTALADIGSPESTQMLHLALADADTRVREAAEEILASSN